MLDNSISVSEIQEVYNEEVIFNCALTGENYFHNLPSVGNKFSLALGHCAAAIVKTHSKIAQTAPALHGAPASAEAPVSRAETIVSVTIAAQPWAETVSRRGAWLPGYAKSEGSFRYADIFNRIGSDYAIDPLFLMAIMHVESRGNAHAVSRSGARGLMQVMPGTGARFGIENPHVALHDPATNVTAAARYIAFLREMFGDRNDLILAAYNAGERAVLHYGRTVPPYRETRIYVRDVLTRYEALRAVPAPG